MSWIVQAAANLGVPIIATAEEKDINGSNVAQVSDHFPGGTLEFNKLSFGLADEPAILSAIKDTKRKTAVIRIRD